MQMDLTSFSPKIKTINLILLFVIASSMIANGWIMGETKDKLGLNSKGLFDSLSPLSFFGGASGGDIKLSGNLGEDAVKLAVMTGAPDRYGQEMGVNFDQVQQSMNVMKQFDPTYGSQKITLQGDDLKRYTDVGLRISCEYCCGANAIVFPNGDQIPLKII